MNVRLFRMELRRALHRRLVWGLIAVALVGIVIAGVVAFVATGGETLPPPASDRISAARFTDWWRPDIPDGVVLPTAIMLFLGGLIGGASVVGAEWRSGGVTTMLTWHPRRHPLLLARLGSAAVLAWLIAVVLQVLFLLALMPSVLAHGTMDGADGAYVRSLATVLVRIGVLAALAAVLGGAIASIGRNTAAALVAVWAWLLVGESLIRGLRPGLSRWLITENVARVVVFVPDPSFSFSRPGWTALATLVAYVAVAVLGATILFTRRDVVMH